MKRKIFVATCLLTFFFMGEAFAQDKRLQVIPDYAGTPVDYFSSFVKNFTEQINNWWRNEGGKVSKKIR